MYLLMKIKINPISYNHNESAIIFYCKEKVSKDYMKIYGFFESEEFKINESRITDITIFRKMVEKFNELGFENENYKENNPNFDINVAKLMCNNKI